jgi:hypothetical protein
MSVRIVTSFSSRDQQNLCFGLPTLRFQGFWGLSRRGLLGTFCSGVNVANNSRSKETSFTSVSDIQRLHHFDEAIHMMCHFSPRLMAIKPGQDKPISVFKKARRHLQTELHPTGDGLCINVAWWLCSIFLIRNAALIGKESMKYP